MSQRIFQVAQDGILGLDGLLHVLANVVHGALVEATTLHELAQGHLLALEVALEDGQLALKNLILVLGAALKLRDSNFKFAIHVILLLFCLALLVLKLGFVFTEGFEALLNVFEATLGIAVAHHVEFVGLDRLGQALGAQPEVR